MKTELYKKVFIKDTSDLPKNIIIHVGNKANYEELVYIDNGRIKKPFRYDENDTPTLSINDIDWYLLPVSDIELIMPSEEEIKEEAPEYAYKIGGLQWYDTLYDAYTSCAKWTIEQIKKLNK